MDFIRTRQYGWMRTVEGQPPVRVVWTEAEPDAKVFEDWSIFRSYDWSRYNRLEYVGMGRQNYVCNGGVRKIVYTNAEVVLADGRDEPCGVEYAATGVGPDGPTFTTDADGLAPCCPRPAPPPPPIGEPCAFRPTEEVPKYYAVVIESWPSRPQFEGIWIAEQFESLPCLYVYLNTEAGFFITVRLQSFLTEITLGVVPPAEPPAESLFYLATGPDITFGPMVGERLPGFYPPGSPLTVEALASGPP